MNIVTVFDFVDVETIVFIKIALVINLSEEYRTFLLKD